MNFYNIEEKSKNYEITFSVLIKLHYLMLKIRMMETSMHDKILTCIVSEHNYHPTKICFNLIKFKKSQKIITESKQQTTCKDESERVRCCEFISFESTCDHEGKSETIKWEEYLVGHFIEESECVSNEQNPNNKISDSSYPNVFERYVSKLKSMYLI